MRTRLVIALLATTALFAAGCSGSTTGTGAATSAPPGPAASGSTTSGGAAGATIAPGPAASWATYHHDNRRTGVDPSSPAAGDVTQAWQSPGLDGAMYAEPLVVGGQVIVATENDTVYSLDPASGGVRWSRHLGEPVAGDSLPCGNIDPSGITGTPVADPSANVVWVVAFQQPAVHQLYSLHLDDGSIVTSRPVDPPGADPKVEQQRGALALAGSTVYVPFGGLFGDCGDYHGWVVGQPASGAGDEVSFKVPNDLQAGIWAPPGPTVLDDGTMYVATGNGTSTDGFDDADAVIRLSPTLTQLDAFAPREWRTMNDNDQDLGTLSPAVVDQMVLQVGKTGIGYLLAGDHLGGVGGEVFQGQLCNSAYGATAVDGSMVFVPCRDGLHGVTVTPGPSARFDVTWSAAGSRAGPPIVVGGVVWDVNADGHLQGFDEHGGQRRYDFTLGDVVTSFPSLAAANGVLYVPAGRTLVAYQGA